MGGAASCCGARDGEAGVKAYQSDEIATRRPQLRKGSIAAFLPHAEDEKNAQQLSWDKDRRNPIATERFNPERQRHGRRTSVVCVTKPPDDFEFICGRLREHPLFSYLADEQIGEIANVIVPVDYVKKAVVYYSWEHGDDVYLIKHGCVQFEQRKEDNDIPTEAAGAAHGRRASVSMMATLAPAPDAPQDDSEHTTLADGAIFGELAGLWSARRGFTAKTVVPTQMFTIGREALRRSITSGIHASRKKVVDLLKTVKLFAELADSCPSVQLDMTELACFARRERFEPHQKIFDAGGTLDKLLIVESGEVRLTAESSEEELVLTRGDYCGEISLVRPGLKWTAAATATMPLVCLTITRDQFRTCLKLNSAAGDGAPVAAAPSGIHDGPIIAPSQGELPMELRNERYSQFQKAGRASVLPSVINAADVEPPGSAAHAELSKLRSILRAKALKLSDFEWCCVLSERERLVGGAYWGGNEGWRAGVRVYLAKHKPSATLVAIRVYDKAALWEDNGMAEARAEYDVLKNLDHNRMLPLLASFQDDKCLFYVFELVLGSSVWALMQQQRFKSLRENVAQHYAAQVLSALGYLHAQGFMHRSIHPEALLIDSRGWLRLGSTMFVRKTRPGLRFWTLCGVPDYLAPEVIQGVGHGRMADVWALGVLIHEMCCGRPPFHSEDPLDAMRLILVDEPKILAQGASQDLILRLLQHEPHRRIGYRCGISPAETNAGINEIRHHAWLQDVDWTAIEENKGDGPHVPPTVPIDELVQQHEDPPSSVKSGFLRNAKTMLSAAEQEAFSNW